MAVALLAFINSFYKIFHITVFDSFITHFYRQADWQIFAAVGVLRSDRH